jgi:hypothetical protein
VVQAAFDDEPVVLRGELRVLVAGEFRGEPEISPESGITFVS